MLNTIAVVCAVFLIIWLISLFFYVREKIRWYSLKMLWIKTIVSCMFLFMTIVAMLKWWLSLTFWCFVISWQILALMWDIWLDLKYLMKDQSDKCTFCWIATFLICQLLFTLWLILNFVETSNIWYLVWWLLVWAIWGAITIPFAKLTKLDYWKFKTSAILYSITLFCTVWVSGLLAIFNGFSNVWLDMMFLWSIFFAISDMILCWTYWWKGKETPINFILNYVFYYFAQFLISLSLLFF
jgi:hypothetical protein